MTDAASAARFPGFAAGAGGYESFYLRAVDPQRPRAVWLRHTIHKRPGAAPEGAIWVTLFDRGAGPPVTLKQAVREPPAAAGGLVRLGDSAFGASGVHGRAERDGRAAAYEIAWSSGGEPLRHLPAAWMYRAPVPRTKLESPHPDARFGGHLVIDGQRVELDGWRGMVGHNWGAEHAQRWIWLHGVAFDDVGAAWLDLALGRIRVGGRTSPWLANGAVSIGPEPIRLGGLLRRPREVRADPLRLTFDLRGAGVRLTGEARSPREQTVVWRYADPAGEAGGTPAAPRPSGEHHVANCSVASLDLVLARDGHVPLRLQTRWGGAYELGMRESDHGLPVQPFGDP